jgi:hypothetical protein
VNLKKNEFSQKKKLVGLSFVKQFWQPSGGLRPLFQVSNILVEKELQKLDGRFAKLRSP